MTDDMQLALYKQISPLYWVVLWMNLIALSRWMGRVQGMGYSHYSIAVTRRGMIRVTQCLRAPEQAASVNSISYFSSEDLLAYVVPAWPQARLRPAMARTGKPGSLAFILPAVPAPP